MTPTIKIGILCSLLLVLSCSEKKKEQTKHSDTKVTNGITKLEEDMDVYFRASGTEPFWSLELSKKHIKLKTITDSTIVPYADPVRAMDSNVKWYKVQTDSTNLDIQIAQLECTNAMSGKISPYTAIVSFHKKGEAMLQKQEGCGVYIGDYRLHDIWVLEGLNGKKINEDDFNKGFPSMEINPSNNTFMGFAGCNKLNGSLFFEKGLLRFTNIATTEMMCDPLNKEDIFLKTLKSTTTYKIENNRLWLSNPSGESLVFKKTD